MPRLLILLLVPACLMAFIQEEPAIRGRTLAQWRLALKDPAGRVRAEAARALQELGEKAAPASADLVTLLDDDDFNVRVQASLALRAIGADAMPALVEGLRKGEPGLRATILTVLSGMTQHAGPAVPVLVPLLESRDPALRHRAASLLGQLNAAGIKALASALEHRDERVRVVALEGLLSAPPGPAVREAAGKALRDGSPTLRLVGLNLAARQQAEGVPLLVQALRDREPSVRQAALQLLAGLGKEAKGAEATLRDLLADRDEGIRSAGLQALASLENLDRKTLEILAEFVPGHDPARHQQAAQALRRAGTEALPVLEKLLGRPELAARLPATGILAQLGADALPLLRKALKDEAADVRATAAAGLGTIADRAKDAVADLTVLLEDRDPVVKLEAAAALYRIEGHKPALLAILLEALEDGDPSRSGIAIQAVGNLGKEVYPALTEQARRKEPAFRRQAIRGLGLAAFSQREAIPLLVSALADPHEEVREAAIEGMRRLQEVARPVLLLALRHEQPLVRAGACRALLPTGPILAPGVAQSLAPRLQDRDLSVRIAAAHALGYSIQDLDQALLVLVEAARSPEEAQRRRAILALADLRPGVLTQPGPLARIDQALTAALEDRDLTVQARAAVGFLSPVIPGMSLPSPPERDDLSTILAQALQKGDARERRLAAEALARLGRRAAPATKVLSETLEREGDLTLRRFAAHALANVGPDARPAVPILKRLLAEGPAVLRQLSVQALGAIGPGARDAVTNLEAALRDDDPFTRCLALEALGWIGPDAKAVVPALAQLVKNPPEPPRPGLYWRRPVPTGLEPGRPRPLPFWDGSLLALQALGRMGPAAAGALPQIVDALSASDPTQRRLAVAVLGRIGSPALPALRDALLSNDGEVRTGVVMALGNLDRPGEDVVKLLLVALEDRDPDVRQQILFALGRIGIRAGDALPALRGLARKEDTDSATRALAERAIQAIEGKPIERRGLTGMVPAKHQRSIEAGLSWLRQEQQPDGRWNGPGNSFPTVLTALAGMAFLSEGSTPKEGKYARELRRAVDWILSQSQQDTVLDGLISTAEGLEASRSTFAHGHALLFLSLVLDDLEAGQRRQAQDVLNRAVRHAIRARTTRGGWGYIASGAGQDHDETATTITMLQGLLAARAAGIPVPETVLERGFEYLIRSTSPQGGVGHSLTQSREKPALTAGAIVVGVARGGLDSAAVRQWYRYCEQNMSAPDRVRDADEEQGRFQWAQAVFVLGEDGWGKLFPMAKLSERLTWSRHRDSLFAHLEKTQSLRGHWSASQVSPVYATAVNLILLQLDRGLLPFPR